MTSTMIECFARRLRNRGDQPAGSSITRATAVIVFCMVTPLLIAQNAPSDDPDEFDKAFYFGQSFFQYNDYTAAYDQFARADALNPDHPAVLYNMALLLAKSGRYSEAQVKTDRYLRLHPSGAERPLVLQLQLRLEFQREVQRVRQLDQEYTDLFTRGRFLYGRNDVSAALNLFEEAERRRPTDPAAIYNQAVLLEKTGDYARAAARYHRYIELEPDDELKTSAHHRIVVLESEIEDMRSKIVCPFCGHKLQATATWCHRCWRGPYLTASPEWNTRPCIEGASATRATFLSGDQFDRNEVLPCLFTGPLREALRYSPAKQEAIQKARESEGWTYDGEVLQGWRNKDGGEIRYLQGPGYLERIDSPTGGEVLRYRAHESGDAWLLDQEEWFIDGMKYTSRFTFGAGGRVAHQQVEYQNVAACNHLIEMSAEYLYDGNVLSGAKLRGGYTGYATEGSPRTDWEVMVASSRDASGRVTKKELVVTSFTKIYMARPSGSERSAVSTLFPGMRVKRPITDVARSGDHCGISGGRYLSNPIDLRPFYFLTPDLAMVLGNGVTRATVTISYPDSFRP
ncbi:MAG TPA: tetratricopeptide repeat protein [Thermoanaerobaculia bacterium]|nr:tetratricopeptide repeat protein [Thermoanaerobaculia bacterium]